MTSYYLWRFSFFIYIIPQYLKYVSHVPAVFQNIPISWHSCSSEYVYFLRDKQARLNFLSASSKPINDLLFFVVRLSVESAAGDLFLAQYPDLERFICTNCLRYSTPLIFLICSLIYYYHPHWGKASGEGHLKNKYVNLIGKNRLILMT